MTDSPSSAASGLPAGFSTLAGGGAAAVAPAHDVTQSMPSVAQIITGIRNALDTLPEPQRTDVMNSARWLEPAIALEIDAAIMALAKKVPVAGSFIGGIVQRSVNAALEQGLTDLVGVPSRAPE